MVDRSIGLKLLTVFNYARRWISETGKYIRRRLGCRPSDMLPENVLLEIFDFNVHEDDVLHIQEWIRLAHVCRRWRSVIFQSPLRLNLRLICTLNTPTSNLLDIWPPLRLVIRNFDRHYAARPFKLDNIIAALEHNDRVCQIKLLLPKLGYFINSAAILEPFPMLTFLQLNGYPYEKPEPKLPDSFLGGSAPRLRSLLFDGLTYMALPKLLLSTTHLVQLSLTTIPRSGYIQPEVIATSLSALTTLEYLRLGFEYPPPRPATRRQPLPPLTRSILPSLTEIEFKGASEYLEVILARIDAPRLDQLGVTFFNQLIFDTPQLFQFISRRPTLSTPEAGKIKFRSRTVDVQFSSRTPNYGEFRVEISCTASEWQLSSLAQVCTSTLLPVSTLEVLYISEIEYQLPRWQDDVENSLWLDLLRPFVAVNDLYISKDFAPRIAPALQELVAGRTMEIFPALEDIFLEGFQSSESLQEGIEKFVAARSLTSRPVMVSRWNRAGRW